MARLMLAASMIALLGHTLAVGTSDELKSSLIRRHGEEKDEILVNSKGGMRRQHNDPTNSYCNHNFLEGVENSNDCGCDQCVHINSPENCRFAATALAARGPKAYVAAPAVSFSVDNSWVPNGTVPYPQHCFAFANGTVMWNPTQEGPPASGYEGTPLCMRTRFPDGAAGEDGATGCTGDYEAITDHYECKQALLCAEVCREPAMDNDALTPEFADKPLGCFREPTTDCGNFNHATTAGSALTGKGLCKLKTEAEVQCWARMPTGCDITLTESATPTIWFVHPAPPPHGSTHMEACEALTPELNTKCNKEDADVRWSFRPPAEPQEVE